MSHKKQKPVSPSAPVPESHTATPPQPERQTKQALLLELMRKEGGATLEDLTCATGWLPHTARAAMTGLRKRGHAIRRERAEGVSRYFVGSDGQMSALGDRIEALRSLSTAQLREEWQRVWKEPAPRLGHDLLRRGIAWKLQEKEQGGLPRSCTRELERLARQLERGRPLGLERAAKPGTRLVRQWRGRTFHVAVMDDGFLFEDRRYSSLSQIAQVITGTKWSGPRFFGLAGGPAAEVVGGEG